MAPYSPKAIANFFLDLAKAKGDTVSPMKLQKLVYYACGWYMGYTGQPLINEAIEAWQYGPVIPSLYREFKQFGSGPITKKATEFNGSMDFPEVPVPHDAGLRSFLENVWNGYGAYTGTKLSEMTHAAGSPWDITWKKSGGATNTDIPPELIASHFREAIAKSRQA